MRRLLAAPLLALTVLGCGSQPTIVPVRNLERPSDMSFVCLDLVDPMRGLLSGVAMRTCRPHLVPNPSATMTTLDAAPDFSNRTFGTFGLVPNTSRGELAVVDLDANRLVDLDPSQPGYNLEPLGSFPEVISATQDGCIAATANRGSCDFSVIDTQRLLARTFGSKVVPSTGAGPASTRVVPHGRSGPLHVAPQEIAFLPMLVSDLPSNPDVTNSCKGGQWIRGSGTYADGWRALVTFPSCDLVAVVSLPSGQIVSSVYVRPEGVVDAGDDPVCPVECVAGLAPAPALDAATSGPDVATPAADVMTLAGDATPASADGSAPSDVSMVAVDAANQETAPPMPDAGAAPTDAAAADAAGAGDAAAAPISGPLRIGALAIRPDGSRVYVGGENAPFVTALELVDGTLHARADGGRIPLHEGARGVSRLRLSVDPYAQSADGKTIGHFLGKDQTVEYLYAFAGDDSVRVVNTVNDPSRGIVEHECDVNVDPQFTPAQSCHPEIEDPAMRPPRRAFVQGPGLRIPTLQNPDQQPPLPTDISFATLRAGTDVSSGDFGFLLASNNSIYVLNVESEAMPSQLPTDPTIGNTYRNYNRASDVLGRPTVGAQPARNFSLTDVPLPTQVSLLGLDGPRVEGPPVVDRNFNFLSDGKDAINTWIWFPDPTFSSQQPWQITWEGGLPGAGQGRGKVQGSSDAVSGGVLEDPGAQFCRSGALPKDIVLFPGCSVDSDCTIQNGQMQQDQTVQLVCRQALPGIPGMCLPPARAIESDLLTTCARHMRSRRRYEVTYSSPKRIELGLKLDELPLPPAIVCNDTTGDMSNNCRLPGYEKFACMTVRPGEGTRCVNSCNDDSDCRGGAVCEKVPGTNVGRWCVEGPPIIPDCWANGANYRVDVGNGFLVVGGATPTAITARAQPDPIRQLEQCVPDLQRHPFEVNRIPLDAPHCAAIDDADPDATIKALKGMSPPAGPPGTWGNPCLFWGMNTDDGGSCATHDLTGGSSGCQPCPVNASTGRPDNKACHLKAFFQNSQIRFVMTNLETFGGDAQITRFDVLGGYAPDVASWRDDIIVTAGARILTGPTEAPTLLSNPGFFPYLFLIDQGRTASSSAGRGQVLRLNPRSPGTDIAIFDSTYSQYPFQIQ